MEVCSHNRFDPNTMLLKINGTKCNLNCRYCSEIKKSHKEAMCIEECQNIMSALPTNCDLILHGGEPLLDCNVVSKIISAYREKGLKSKISIQTNGIIDAKMKQLLLENSDILKIGISIDGPNEQNKLRVDYCNNPVFKQVDETLTFFLQNNIQIKCIATVNSVNVHDPIGSLEYFLSHKNIKQVRFNPCFDMEDTGVADYAIRPLQFLDYTIKLVDYWIQHRIYREVRIDPIQSEIEAVLSQASNPYINCCKFISVYPNGKATICDALDVEYFEYGLISEIFTNAEHKYMDKLYYPCKNCVDFAECGGGCVAIFRRYSGRDELLQEYCTYRKKLKQYIKGIILEMK